MSSCSQKVYLVGNYRCWVDAISILRSELQTDQSGCVRLKISLVCWAAYHGKFTCLTISTLVNSRRKVHINKTKRVSYTRSTTKCVCNTDTNELFNREHTALQNTTYLVTREINSGIFFRAIGSSCLILTTKIAFTLGSFPDAPNSW